MPIFSILPMIQAATAGCFFHKTAPPGRSHFSGGAVFDLRLDLHNWKSSSIFMPFFHILSKRKPHETTEKWLSHAVFAWWAIRDSNPGPTGYEPAALTN